MPVFTYKAINNIGAELSGFIDANTKEAAVSVIIQRGLTPVYIGDSSRKENTLFHLPKSSPGSEEILFFIRNFGIALKSGVTVISALDIMEKDTTHRFMKEMISKVGASVRSGVSLSESLLPYERYFTPAFTGLLKAGEVSGGLGNSFALIGEYLKREFSLKQKLRSAMIYPLILIIASVMVVALLMIFVLPKLSNAFMQSGVSLPLLTKIVLAISNIFTYSILLDLGVLGLIVGLAMWIRSSKVGRRNFSLFLEKAPIARDMMKAIGVVRFLRTLGNLLTAGVPILEALNITAYSLGHYGMQDSVLDIKKIIESGSQLSEGMEKHPNYFSPVIVGLVRVGEETGNLGGIMVEVSEFYDDELNNALKNAMALLEPLLLLFMGIIVGAIALSVLLPIYQLVSKLA